MMQKLFISVLCLLFASILQAQRYEYVYRNQADSSVNCYLKIFPAQEKIRGLVIRDYSALPDMRTKSPFKFLELCAEQGIMTVYAVTSKQFPELFCSDSSMMLLDDIVSEIVREYHIPRENIFAGGISASGTRALRYAQYCSQGRSKGNIKIKGVFVVDSPLDLARFYRSVYLHRNNFKAGMLWEANHMPGVFSKLFSGPPDSVQNEFIQASVFSASDSLGGNARYLKDVHIIAYHEPDIDWWMNERGATYFDINSYDIAAFVLKLTLLGNKQVKLVTTTGKGFDREGNRNCHSWTIVDEPALTAWITAQLE